MTSYLTNRKYHDIFNTGKTLFWKHGIKRVTIEEICKEAKISKMTFYKYFPNKFELAKTILNDLFEASMVKFDELTKSSLPFSKKLEALFLMKLEALNETSQEFINDIYINIDFGLKKVLDEFTQKSQTQIANFYKKSQTDGNIRKDVNINFIMAYSHQVPQLMKDEELMAQYNSPKEFVLEVMNLLFYGIVTKNE